MESVGRLSLFTSFNWRMICCIAEFEQQVMHVSADLLATKGPSHFSSRYPRLFIHSAHRWGQSLIGLPSLRMPNP